MHIPSAGIQKKVKRKHFGSSQSTSHTSLPCPLFRIHTPHTPHNMRSRTTSAILALNYFTLPLKRPFLKTLHQCWILSFTMQSTTKTRTCPFIRIRNSNRNKKMKGRVERLSTARGLPYHPMIVRARLTNITSKSLAYPNPLTGS